MALYAGPRTALDRVSPYDGPNAASRGTLHGSYALCMGWTPCRVRTYHENVVFRQRLLGRDRAEDVESGRSAGREQRREYADDGREQDEDAEVDVRHGQHVEPLIGDRPL
jgi:hypothetical protein